MVDEDVYLCAYMAIYMETCGTMDRLVWSGRSSIELRWFVISRSGPVVRLSMYSGLGISQGPLPRATNFGGPPTYA